MSRLVFGVDLAPEGSSDRTAYVARAACGHVRALVIDGRPGAVEEFLAMGVAGLQLERIPIELAKAGIGECEICEPPEQTELAL